MKLDFLRSPTMGPSFCSLRSPNGHTDGSMRTSRETAMVRSVSGNRATFAHVLVNEMFASGLLLAKHQETRAH